MLQQTCAFLDRRALLPDHGLMTGWRRSLFIVIFALCACSNEETAAPPDAAPRPADLAAEELALPDSAADVSADLAVDAWGTGPPYPIILAHGFFGWDKIGPLDYFYKVKAALVKKGHDVHVTSVDPFNASLFRGKQLLKQVEAVLKKSGAARVNIIGHSQGGIDARYVAAQLPARVASVTTVATPHLGIKIADVLLKQTSGYTKALAQAFFKALARPFYGDVAKDADIVACLTSMTTSGMIAFNKKYPDQPGIDYYSIGGRSDLKLAESQCLAPKAPPFITKYAKVKDPIDPLLLLTAKLLSGKPSTAKPNDGMVQVAKVKWGTWIGCIPADHFDQVGQILGDGPGKGNSFSHITFYQDLAAWLVSQGY